MDAAGDRLGEKIISPAAHHINGKKKNNTDVFFRVCGALGLTQGFEALLPEHHLSPQDMLAVHTMPKRARGNKTKDKSKWGVEQ